MELIEYLQNSYIERVQGELQLYNQTFLSNKEKILENLVEFSKDTSFQIDRLNK